MVNDLKEIILLQNQILFLVVITITMKNIIL